MTILNQGNACFSRWAFPVALAALIAQTRPGFSEIIPASRRVDWSAATVGVPGGIPHRTTIYATLSAGATEAQIQAAINSCPSNQVVFLSPGTYNITSGLNFTYRSGITLRGSGTNTVLSSRGGSQVIHLGANSLWNSAIYPHQWDAGRTIVSGCVMGSSNIVVSGSSGLASGQLLLVDENNDTNFVFDCTGGTPRLLSQTVTLQSISGNVLTVWPPLCIDFKTNLDARVKTLGSPSYQINFSGVEDLRIDGSATGSATTGIMIEQGYGCWLSNVVLSLVPNYHVMLTASARLSIIHCSCLNVPVHGPNHFGFGLEASISGSLIENCIAYRIFPGIEVNYGCSGNVISYNFVWDAYQDNFGQGCGIDANHGPHNVMNLYEGNVTDMIQSDGYFGSTSHNTVFRNWCSGWGPTYTNVNSKAISLNRWSWYWNIVGNVLGTYSVAQIYEGTANGDNTPKIYQLGYPNMGNNSYNGTSPPNAWHNPGTGPSDNQWLDLLVKTNLIRHGNWDTINNSVIWDPAISDHSIPNSMYLAGKPSWFGNRTWPPFDPATATTAMLSPTNIPAGFRFVFGVEPPIGAPDITPPTVPTALTAVAVATNQINLSWTASTDNVGVTGYLVERSQGVGATNFIQVGTPSATSFGDTGLSPATVYNYRVRATDAAPNLSPYSSVASAATFIPDTQPPTVPAGVTATAASTNQINLSWAASTDNVGVTGYLVERSQGVGSTNFSQVGTPSVTSFSDTGLLAATTYNYRVRATDAAGNLSAYSGVSSATTSNAPPDQTPPSAPTGLTAAPVETNQISLIWTASADNVGVTGYRVERSQGAGGTNYSEIGTSVSVGFSDTGLTAGTVCNYRVRAADAAGNLSGYSSVATATVGNQTTPAGLVAAYSFDQMAGTTVTDASGNGNTGTISGATWSTGKYGGALNFNGINNVVVVSNSASLNVSTGMTLEAWVYPTAVMTNWHTILHRQTDAYYLHVSCPDGPMRPAGGAIFNGGEQYAADSSSVPVNAWSHIAARYNGTNLTVYVNCVQVASMGVSGTIQTNSNSLRIGGNTYPGQFFHGLIDEVRVYNRALSLSEILTDKNTSVGGQLPRPVAPTNFHVVTGP